MNLYEQFIKKQNEIIQAIARREDLESELTDIKREIFKKHKERFKKKPVGKTTLNDEGFEITLVYPKNELRNEYLDRYIERDSPYDFIGTFMKHWNIWIDELKEQKYCKHIVLDKGQYLQDVL